MIAFDIDHPKYFTRQNRKQQYLSRTIYIFLAMHLFWILSNFSRKLHLEKYYEVTKMAKIPIIVFLFFISDEFERLILALIYFFVVTQKIFKL